MLPLQQWLTFFFFVGTVCLVLLFTYYQFILTCFDAGAFCPRMRVLTSFCSLNKSFHSVIILFTQKLIDCILLVTCRASCTQLWKYAVCLTVFTKSIWMECMFHPTPPPTPRVAPFSLEWNILLAMSVVPLWIINDRLFNF